jgi:hypothetical protein
MGSALARASLVGTSGATATCQPATPAAHASLAGTASGAGALSAQLASRAGISGTAAGASTLTATAVPGASLTGTAGATSSLSGAVLASAGMSGQASGAGALEGILSAAAGLSGAAAGTSSLAAPVRDLTAEPLPPEQRTARASCERPTVQAAVTPRESRVIDLGRESDAPAAHELRLVQARVDARTSYVETGSRVSSVTYSAHIPTVEIAA